jgi:diguanylate cyclase (GGDEF)-like protein/PAS domain S-box-containing protein
MSHTTTSTSPGCADGNAMPGAPRGGAPPYAATDGTTVAPIGLDDGLLSTILASGPDLVFATDPTGAFLYANAATRRCLGVGQDSDLARLDPLDLYDVASRRHLRFTVLPECLTTGMWSGEVVLKGRLQGPLAVSQVTIAHRGAGGDLTFFSTVAHDITALRARHDTLVRRETLFRSLVESSPGTVAVVSPDGTVCSIDADLGLRPDDTIGTRGLAAVHPDDLPAVTSAIERVRIADGRTERLQLRTHGTAATWRHLDISLTNRIGIPAVGGIVVNALDITDRVDAESRFRLGFEHAAIGMSVRDLQGRYLQVNRALCRLLGRDEFELIGRSPEQFTHPDDVTIGSTAVQRLLDSAAGTCETAKRYLRADGAVVWTEITLSLVRDASGQPQYFFSQVQDVTDRKRAEDNLFHQARYDGLTGLPNRALLLERLELALRRASRSANRTAVLYIDVDQFKLVNDSLGHAIGDRLLVDIARRLREGVRTDDTVGRFGGDEFVVICEGLAGESDARTLAERVGHLIDAPIPVGTAQHYVTVSTGVAVGGPCDTAEELLSDADAAMYRAKARGRARIELFDKSLRTRASDRLDLKSALRRSVESGDFSVVFQPVISLANGQLLGAEALARWEHPVRGAISPTEFVPIAEEAGLIGRIGQQVLAQSLDQVGWWRRNVPDGDHLWVAVNLSARQLQDAEIVELLADAITASGSRPDALHVEITESVLIDEPDACATNLAAIRALGVPISLDDFGTGYSSLAFLRRFPIDTIKIDRSFVAGLCTDAHDSSIVTAVVGLGNAFGLHVLAEGIETPDQLHRLQALGCDQGQGYLWSRGLPGAEFRVWATDTRGGAARKRTLLGQRAPVS